MYVKLHSLSKDDLGKKCLGDPVCQVRVWWRNNFQEFFRFSRSASPTQKIAWSRNVIPWTKQRIIAHAFLSWFLRYFGKKNVLVTSWYHNFPTHSNSTADFFYLYCEEPYDIRKVFNFQELYQIVVLQPLTMLLEMSILNIALNLPSNKLVSVKSPLWKVHGAEVASISSSSELAGNLNPTWTCLTPNFSVLLPHRRSTTVS